MAHKRPICCTRSNSDIDLLGGLFSGPSATSTSGSSPAVAIGSLLDAPPLVATPATAPANGAPAAAPANGAPAAAPAARPSATTDDIMSLFNATPSPTTPSFGYGYGMMMAPGYANGGMGMVQQGMASM